MSNKDLDLKKESSLLPEIDRMLGRFLGNWPAFSRSAFAGFKEMEKEFILTAEIPGIPKEEVKVELNGNVLSISAEHNEESGDETRGHRRQYHNFQQSFTLPANVDPAQIEAHHENGLLEIILPKSTQSQSKKIEIKSGAQIASERNNKKDQMQNKKH